MAAAEAASHPLDARFVVFERWPGYFLIRQRALASAAVVLARGGVRGPGPWPRPPSGVRGAEQGLVARGGRLAGRPDRFDGHILTEYKSSLPDPTWSGAVAVIDGFCRQLRLYAAIIAEATGRWPTLGRIVAASGQTMDVTLVPTECEEEACAALAALDALNCGVLSGVPPEGLAQPNMVACGGCPFQAVCPAFWRWLERSGPQDFSNTVGEGDLVRIESGQDGDLYTAYLDLRRQGAPTAERWHSTPIISAPAVACCLACHWMRR